MSDSLTAPTGGYIVLKTPLVKVAASSQSKEDRAGISQYDLRSLNGLQRTAWSVNAFILDVQMRAWHEAVALPDVPLEKPLAPPQWASYETWRSHLAQSNGRSLPDEVWNGMSEEDQKAHKRTMAELHAHNAAVKGKQRAFIDNMMLADELRAEPAIYFPHTRDFRGRVYPAVTCGLHPQASDVAKSLLQFSEGVELGERGLYWLMVRAANCYGQDKLPLDGRVAWTKSQRIDVIRSAQDPFAHRWWCDADEPWGMLATCVELALAWSMPDHKRFISHLPVPLDGTCSGLQHLSAMGLDPVGARATNLARSEVREDIYMEVADAIKTMIVRDTLAGVEGATAWAAKFDDPSKRRKIVKRAVMTTPYGVTDRGIRRQLIKDGFTKDIAEGKSAAADYLTDRINEALSLNVEAARAIMAWLQQVGTALAEAGLPFDWVTPTGSTIRQAYYTTVERRIATLCGTLQLYDPAAEAGLNVRKQSAGAAPNFVHSFDAAHLSITVALMLDQGVRSFALIHDSYGTHAGLTDTLSRTIREAFISIYKEDWLQKTADHVRSYAPHVEIPKPPKRGAFDLMEVIDAPFCFS